ncbi:MAG: outer-membrane lipoprotein carrier protein LolA [Planctomycetaceae bacterium]|nr:outer-membrane lipoprotein carrier protein LolA [Planctomycetaceae bacterium]
MRRNVWMVLSLAVVTCAVLASRARGQGGPEAGGPAPVATPNPAATPGPPANAGPAADAGQMQQLIKLWALQSSRLKSLDVEMTRVDEDPAWGDPERYEGRAMFKSPNLAWIDFKRVTVNDKDQKVLTPHERIICTGAQVWQYRCVEKQIRIFDLGREARERALQQGPLPFLFNFNQAEALDRYVMALVNQDAKSYIVKIIPRLEIDQAEFQSALIRLDKKYLLPTQIHLTMVGGKSKKLYTLTNIEANKPVADENFKSQLVPGWKVVRDEQPVAPSAAAAPGASPDPAAGHPAMKRPAPGARLR